jgi:hypothetical protein
VTRTIAAAEGEPFWVRAKYEVLTPDIHISAHRVVYATAVRLADLQPVVDPGVPGTDDPGNPGSGDPGSGGPGSDGSEGQPTGGSDADHLAATGGGAAIVLGIMAALALAVGAVLVQSRRQRRA